MTTCQKCGSSVTWTKKGARWYCFNQDGTDHWDACSKILFDNIKRCGEHFVEHGRETVRGYKSEQYGKKAYSREGRPIVGKFYRPVRHADGCNAVPWEDCQLGLRCQ